MSVKALLATSDLFLQLMLAASSAVHPSTCRAIWLFHLPCTELLSALVNQVKAWSIQECHERQEKCMCEIVKELPTYLEIKHISFSTYKTTEISFEFKPLAAPFFCKMRALSTTSQIVTSPNDYCLLYNLIHGSGLTQTESYKEICNEVTNCSNSEHLGPVS